MKSVVFAHCPEDAAWARTLAAAYGPSDCLTLAVSDTSSDIVFGPNLFIVALWSGAGMASDALARLVGGRPRAGLTLLSPAAQPPDSLATASAPILLGLGDVGADAQQLRAARQAIGSGGRIESALAPPPSPSPSPPRPAPAREPVRERAPRPARQESRAPSPPPVSAIAAEDEREEVGRRSAGAGRVWGLVFGAVTGAALFFGLLAPRVADWLRAPEEAALPPVHAGFAAPPRARPVPQEPLPGLSPPAPPSPAPAMLLENETAAPAPPLPLPATAAVE